MGNKLPQIGQLHRRNLFWSPPLPTAATCATQKVTPEGWESLRNGMGYSRSGCLGKMYGQKSAPLLPQPLVPFISKLMCSDDFHQPPVQPSHCTPLLWGATFGRSGDCHKKGGSVKTTSLNFTLFTVLWIQARAFSRYRNHNSSPWRQLH